MRITATTLHPKGRAAPTRKAGWLGIGALILLFGVGVAFADDPPARVARLSVLAGEVSYAAAGQQNWSAVGINRPLIAGDRLLTGDDSRVELQLGGASVRLSSNTASSFLALDEQTAQIELSQGTLNLDVRSIDDGQSYEVDTPTVALVVRAPGEYRIDINGDNSATVSVFSGAGTVYGSNSSQYALTGRQSYRFGDAALTDVVGSPLPEADAFDNWCFARDDAERSVATQTYVSPEVVGASDLDAYGEWRDVDDYGYVWFPNTVVAGWAPYRYGHWVWIAPWGWTWIDDAPWGYAPFHYGRWAYVGGVWGWVPGPRHVRAVYSPALVAFYGGGHWGVSIGIGGAPVGWCPLGPGEVYVPPYRVTHRYFTRINVTNVVNINHVTINNYYNNGYRHGHGGAGIRYRYHAMPAAMTVVPHDAFVRARPVDVARLHVDAGALKQSSVLTRPGLKPGRDSLGLREEPGRRDLPPPNAVFARSPVMHERPPAATQPRDNGLRPQAPSGEIRTQLPGERRPGPARSPDAATPSAHFARPEHAPRERIAPPAGAAGPHPEPAVPAPADSAPAHEGALPSSHFVQRRSERVRNDDTPVAKPAPHDRLIDLPRETPRPPQRAMQRRESPDRNGRERRPAQHARPEAGGHEREHGPRLRQ
jgi:hypothetical protein